MTIRRDDIVSVELEVGGTAMAVVDGVAGYGVVLTYLDGRGSFVVDPSRCVPVVDPVASATVRAWREVEADVRAGVVPPTIASFAELHDHVDANEYGGMADGELAAEQVNEVQGNVDSLIRRHFA